jgi:hypothetical protein
VNQLLKFRSFVCLQFEMPMFAHDRQYSRMECCAKSSLTVH